MKIKTTINCIASTKSKLNAAAQTTNLSVSDLVILLVQRIAKEHLGRIRKNIPVEYQKRRPKKLWRKQHLAIQPYDYERCLDLGKFQKFSLSLIVSMAVDLYLEEIIDSLNNEISITSDNYPSHQYFMDNGTHNGINYWIIFWGKPEGILKIHY